ncbi:MAG: hypothetical protein ACJ72E_12610 [Marmoricola sp.]
MDRSVRIPALTVALVVMAVLCTWVLGHLPWVMDGFRTNRDSTVGGSAEGLADVRLAIPLVAGRITELVAFTAIGAIVAMLLPLVFPDLPRSLAVVTCGLTVAATTLVITFASRSGISSHATDAFAGDQRVLDGLVTGVLLTALGAAVLGSLASAQIGFLPLATAVLVSQLPVWLGALLDDRSAADAAYRVLAVVMLTAAFVLSVRRALGWIVLWPVALLVVWTAAPLRIATGRLEDRLRPASGVNGANLSDVFADAREVFRASYWHAQQVWWPGVLAVVLALAWVLVQRRRGDRAPRPSPVA